MVETHSYPYNYPKQGLDKNKAPNSRVTRMSLPEYGTSESRMNKGRTLPSRRNSRRDTAHSLNGVTRALHRGVPRREDAYRDSNEEVLEKNPRRRSDEVVRDHDDDTTCERPHGKEVGFLRTEENNLKGREESHDEPGPFSQEQRSRSFRRPRNENFENETSVSNLRSERPASPRDRSYSGLYDQNSGPLVLRKTPPFSLQQCGQKSAFREYDHLQQHEDNRSTRSGRSTSSRLSRSRSRLKVTATGDGYSDSESERRAPLPSRPKSYSSERKTQAEETIATLKEFTSFKTDADLDITSSPALMEFSSPSDNDESDNRTSEQVTHKLNDSYTKLEIATNLMTAPHLKSHATPDVSAEGPKPRVREAKQVQGQKVASPELTKIYETSETNEESELKKLTKASEDVLKVSLPQETVIHFENSNEDSNNEASRSNFHANSGSDTLNHGTSNLLTEPVAQNTQLAQTKPQPRELNRRATVEDMIEPEE